MVRSTLLGALCLLHQPSTAANHASRVTALRLAIIPTGLSSRSRKKAVQYHNARAAVSYDSRDVYIQSAIATIRMKLGLANPWLDTRNVCIGFLNNISAFDEIRSSSIHSHRSCPTQWSEGRPSSIAVYRIEAS